MDPQPSATASDPGLRAGQILRDALRERRLEDDRYPADEKALKAEVVQRLRAEGHKAGEAKKLVNAASKQLIAARELLRDRRRAREPTLFALAGDEARLYAITAEELVAAVAGERRAHRYPASLPKLLAALRLTTGGKAWGRNALPGILQDTPGVSKVMTGTGKARKVAATLPGEEDFARSLKKAEVTRLRIEHADLLTSLTIGDTEARVPVKPPPLPPSAPPADAEIAAWLERAYQDLVRQTRQRSVPMPRLRALLPEVERAQLDRVMVGLCRAERFELFVHDHPNLLDAAERAAQLTWPGTARVYYFIGRLE